MIKLEVVISPNGPKFEVEPPRSYSLKEILSEINKNGVLVDNTWYPTNRVKQINILEVK